MACISPPLFGGLPDAVSCVRCASLALSVHENRAEPRQNRHDSRLSTLVHTRLPTRHGRGVSVTQPTARGARRSNRVRTTLMATSRPVRGFASVGMPSISKRRVPNAPVATTVCMFRAICGSARTTTSVWSRPIPCETDGGGNVDALREAQRPLPCRPPEDFSCLGEGSGFVGRKQGVGRFTRCVRHAVETTDRSGGDGVQRTDCPARHLHLPATGPRRRKARIEYVWHCECPDTDEYKVASLPGERRGRVRGAHRVRRLPRRLPDQRQRARRA